MPHPPVVTKDDVVDLLPKLKLQEVEIAMDAMFVKDQVFVNAVDQSAKFKSLVCMGMKKKLTSSEIMEGMEQVVDHDKRHRICVSYLHLDNEFKPIKRQMEKKFQCEVKLANPHEHVPDVKRSNRTLQDRVRVSYHCLPFHLFVRAMIRNECMIATR